MKQRQLKDFLRGVPILNELELELEIRREKLAQASQKYGRLYQR